MDLYVVRQLPQTTILASQTNPWLYFAAIEAETTRRSGEAIELLAVGLARGVKALFVRAIAALRGEGLVPVRVAARQQRVDLAARNDDRAAA